MTINKSPVVKISYEELQSSNPTLLSRIAEAFGSGETCKGIVAITDIPLYPPLRSKALRLIHQLATNTSPDALKQLEDPKSYYSVGWSHGKEKVEGDKLDTGKGSFYFNPITDRPLEDILSRDFGHLGDDDDDDDERRREEDAKLQEFQRHAESNGALSFYAPNVWLEQEESLSDLRDTVMEMGQLIRDVGILVAKRCDEYVTSQYCDYPVGKIHGVIENSLCCKARLLHYFPVETAGHETTSHDSLTPAEDSEANFSDWCGWHNDHGSLTGLVPAMYFNANGEEVPCPDPAAGLYIKSRNGELVHVQIPTNALAFQIGETSQIHSGGILQATSHAVRGCDPSRKDCQGISREAFAVFMEPEYFGDMDIPPGKTIEDAQKLDTEKWFPKNVRTLRSRWTPGMNFGQFTEATYAAFY